MVTWEVIHFGSKFDFCEKYTTYMVEKAINSGASQQAIGVIRQQMREMKVILDNPLLNAAVTFTEPSGGIAHYPDLCGHPAEEKNNGRRPRR